MFDLRGSAIFNDDGDDNDFRIESDTKTHMFFLDASTDRIGINNSSPSVRFDVAGAGKFTDSLHIEVDGNPFLKLTKNGSEAGQVRANGDNGIGFYGAGHFALAMNRNTGFIGIGIDLISPSYLLQTKGTAGVNARFERNGTTAGTQGYMDLQISDFDDNTGDVILNAKSGADFAICSDYGNHYLIIEKGGKVGIDVSNPTHTLHLPDDDAYKTTTTTWTTTSDARLKKDIVVFADGLNIIRGIQPKKYKYNGLGGTPNDGVDYVGVLAQDIKTIAPYCHRVLKVNVLEKDVATFPGDNLVLMGQKTVKDSLTGQEKTEKIYEGEVDGFNSHALFFVLVNATKELDTQNQQLKDQLEEQQKLILELQKRLTLLEKK
ncbi:MAG: tail fiber domain-containing protein [Bacteroidetes bacterium]|nr:tail fiber domain-containing protein [Bacteroidota bacterium]